MQQYENDPRVSKVFALLDQYGEERWVYRRDMYTEDELQAAPLLIMFPWQRDAALSCATYDESIPRLRIHSHLDRGRKARTAVRPDVTTPSPSALGGMGGKAVGSSFGRSPKDLKSRLRSPPIVTGLAKRTSHMRAASVQITGPACNSIPYKSPGLLPRPPANPPSPYPRFAGRFSRGDGALPNEKSSCVAHWPCRTVLAHATTRPQIHVINIPLGSRLPLRRHQCGGKRAHHKSTRADGLGFHNKTKSGAERFGGYRECVDGRSRTPDAAR